LVRKESKTAEEKEKNYKGPQKGKHLLALRESALSLIRGLANTAWSPPLLCRGKTELLPLKRRGEVSKT